MPRPPTLGTDETHGPLCSAFSKFRCAIAVLLSSELHFVSGQPLKAPHSQLRREVGVERKSEQK